MINRLLSFSVQAHWAVVFVTVMVAAYGIFELTRLPLDALPDITSKQAMINYSAAERLAQAKPNLPPGVSHSSDPCPRSRRDFHVQR